MKKIRSGKILMKKLYLETPANFSFKSTVYSHGWADLRSFHLPDNLSHISYIYNDKSKKIHHLEISEVKKRGLEIVTDTNLNDSSKSEILSVVKRMFRLNEDYEEFYTMAKNSKEFTWVVKYGAGRMLRCASLWEDMVKMLCTTNCTWRLTQIMTENLLCKLGSFKKNNNTGQKVFAFPEPEDIASHDETYLRNEIKMGYRAPYLLEFAHRIVNGELNLDEFEDQSLATTDLYKQIRQIKGFGDYAVSNLLKLLGRYDYMGADSWSRQRFFDKHHQGKTVDDKKIYSHYKRFGKWAGLFFWMDVSKDWYTRDIPW
jgi:N-glycosylase/DNA lyase